jgi:hypothetical protein
LVADFSKSPAGLQVTFHHQAGTAVYEALKDGMPYASEDKMDVKGALPVVLAADGTFSFHYDSSGDRFIYDQCSLPQVGVLRCFFHKRLGSSKKWVMFYQR